MFLCYGEKYEDIGQFHREYIKEFWEFCKTKRKAFLGIADIGFIQLLHSTENGWLRVAVLRKNISPDYRKKQKKTVNLKKILAQQKIPTNEKTR